MNKLFDLRNLSSNLAGYWADAEKNIWSTKQGSARRLTKSSPSTSQYAYWSFSRNGYSSTMRVDQLDRMLEADSRFRDYRNSLKTNSPAFAAFSPVAKGFIIGSVTTAGISFSSSPRVHATEAEARKECERLATAHPQKAFMYVEIKGTVKATGFNWS